MTLVAAVSSSNPVLRHALARISGCPSCWSHKWRWANQEHDLMQGKRAKSTSSSDTSKTPESMSLLSSDSSTSSKDPEIDLEGKEHFRTLDLLPPNRGKDILGPRSRIDYEKPAFDEFEKSKEARYRELPTDVDWTTVWPTARIFHPATVPLPVRMGYIQKKFRDRKPVPSKWVNTELMKIPNFLHLTPKHVKQHCEALKKFCTPWPEHLKNDEDCHRHFPMEVITSDYLYASPSLRDPRTRTVVLQFKLSSLNLDYHARDKFRRLLRERYNPKTDMVTITTDACPLRQQNKDYAYYLVTALYFESWKTEEWEITDFHEKDWEKFHWERSECKDKAARLLQAFSDEFKKDESKLKNALEEDEKVKKYRESLSKIYEGGETDENWDQYKDSVKQLVGL